jgi:hypothetical protein
MRSAINAAKVLSSMRCLFCSWPLRCLPFWSSLARPSAPSSATSSQLSSEGALVLSQGVGELLYALTSPWRAHAQLHCRWELGRRACRSPRGCHSYCRLLDGSSRPTALAVLRRPNPPEGRESTLDGGTTHCSVSAPPRAPTVWLAAGATTRIMLTATPPGRVSGENGSDDNSPPLPLACVRRWAVGPRARRGPTWNVQPPLGSWSKPP